ncbi:Antitoxin HigA-2 [Anaerolineae bacterium]|nr:Antitoxin HigA-2 [Anaerolineae bacterium]
MLFSLVMNRIQETLSEMAKDLHSVGAIDKTKLRQFDLQSLPPVPNYTANQIANIRHKLGLSQVVFAAYLNVSDRAVKKWEQGDAKPCGATLKLLSVIERKGLDVVL